MHPDPDALAAARPGRAALRGRNPNGSVADIAGVCDTTGVVLGLMPHPENHIVARQHPAPPAAAGGGAAAPRAPAVRQRRPPRRGQRDGSDAPTSTIAPFTDIDLPLDDRRDGKVRVSYALPDGHRLFVTTDRLSAFDRVIAAVPYKGQVLNQLSAWWFDQTADIVANHVVSVPDPNVLIARTAMPLPVEVVVRGYITGVTDTALWTQYAAGARVIYGHDFPDGLTKNTRSRHADRHARPPRPSTAPTTCRCRAPRSPTRGLVDAELWERVQAVALALFAPRQRAAARGRADPRRHEVRVRPDRRRRAAADRRGAHARLVALVGRGDLRRAARRRRRAREPRQGGRPAGARRRSATAATAPCPTLPPDVWTATTARYIDAFERLTGTAFVPGRYPVAERIDAALAGLEIYS